MKSRLRGMLCSCLLFVIQGAYLSAQEPPPQTPPPPQTAPGTPPVPKPTVQMPPPSPQTAVPAVAQSKEHDTGGDNISVEVFVWQLHDTMAIKGGAATTVSDPGALKFPGTAKYAEGLVATFPTTKETSLEFTYWAVKAAGTSVLPMTENFFGNDFASKDSLNTRWLERDFKLSWNYLTWPYPSNGAKFRVKLLFEMQYSQITGDFDAPADPNAITTNGSKQVILPTLGMGFEYHVGKHLRLEGKASGFAIPKHADLWGAEANAVFRFGHFEGTVGARAFHDKSSPKQDEYFSQTMYGPYIGLRYMFK